MDLERVIEEYKERYALFDNFTAELWGSLDSLLPSILGKRFILEARTKTPEDLKRKISQPEKHYVDPFKEVHDLSGLRIILHHRSDATQVIDLIKRELEVDSSESWFRTDPQDPEKFGYLAEGHIIVSIPSSRSHLREWQRFVGLRAEIQVRTILQHGWDVISHRYDYKAQEDIPSETRRRLFRLSALIELADEQLDIFSKEAEEVVRGYKGSLDRGNLDIEINVDSLRTYIETSEEVRYWNTFLETNIGVTVATWGDLSRDVAIAKFCGLKSVGEIDRILREARGWGEPFLKNYYKRVLAQFAAATPALVTVVVNGIVTMLIIASFDSKFTAQALWDSWGYGTVYILDAAREAKKKSTIL